MEIILRSHNELKYRKKARKDHQYSHEQPKYNRFLVWDTETKDVPEKHALQALHFGSFVIMNDGAIEAHGIFYNKNMVDDEELKVLKSVCEKDITLSLYTLKEFIESVWYPVVYYQHTHCVAFNLPFDASRLALGYGKAKKRMANGFDLFLCEDHGSHPPLRIKHFGAAENMIEFQSTSFSNFKGFFVDCHTLAGILMGKKHVTLAKACEEYNKVYKFLDKNQTFGKITEKLVSYNLIDTKATVELFTNLKAEFERFGLTKLQLHRIWSTASLGKAMLSELNIKPFAELNPNFPPKIFGKIMQCYYGGRVEAIIRKKPVEVEGLDFTSMYPTLFIIMGLYDFLIAEKITYEDTTEQIRKLVENITLEDLQNPEIWKNDLCAVVEVLPDEDLFPVRAKYDGETPTVALNYITSKKSIYYGLPSVILSRLRTGKVPKIVSAIGFKAVGKQKELKTATILGIKLDPNKDNLFKFLVEQKQKSRIAKDGRDENLKLTVNSIGYGIFIELQRADKETAVNIFSGNSRFSASKRFEKPGKYYNPIISTMITDGTKLLLGTVEKLLGKHNEVMAYCDTDGVYVPSLHSKEVIEFFDPINPYDRKLIPHLLKSEGRFMIYCLNAKRYTIFSINEQGNFEINDEDGVEDYSLHGLGHLTKLSCIN